MPASAPDDLKYSLCVCKYPEWLVDIAGMGHIAYQIDDDLHGRAKALAAYQGRTFKAWVERALAREVERQEAERAEAERKRRSR